MQKHTITYTTIDKRAREFVWETKNQDISNGVVHFITHGDWPEFAKVKEERNWNADWGLIGENIFGRNCGYISLPNCIQYYYYHDVLCRITKILGEECVRNQEFAKAILKRALEIAKEKDNKYNEQIRERNPKFVGSNSNQDMLKRAKNRLSYTKRKAAEKNAEYYENEQANTYAYIIEEYGLFAILEIHT